MSATTAMGGSAGPHEAMVRMIRGYHEVTAPLAAYYRGKGLHHVVSALGGAEDVTARMSATVTGIPDA